MDVRRSQRRYDQLKKTKNEADRHVPKGDRLMRVLLILRKVSGKKNWKPETLAAEFGCTKKAILRDVALIRSAGIDLTFDRSSGSYRLGEHFPGLPASE